MALTLIAASIVGGLFSVTIAGVKNRDLAAWFLFGLIVPVVAAVAVCVVPRLDDGR